MSVQELLSAIQSFLVALGVWDTLAVWVQVLAVTSGGITLSPSLAEGVD